MSSIHDVAAKIVIVSAIAVVIGSAFLGYKKLTYDAHMEKVARDSKFNSERSVECDKERVHTNNRKMLCDGFRDIRVPSSYWDFSKY